MGKRSGNKKQRRDASNTSSIPLAHPSRDAPTGKTLVDLIAERQPRLTGSSNAPVNADNFEVVTIDPSNLPKDDKQSDNDSQAKKEEEGNEDLPPVLDTLLLSVPLTTLHITLAYLAAHQYAQTIPLKDLAKESAMIAFPMLTLLIHLAHGHIVPFGRGKQSKTQKTKAATPATTEDSIPRRLFRAMFPPTLKTVFFLPIALFFGTFLVATTNNAPYYAVMRQAPAIGTLWVWSVLEMPVGAAVVGALGPLAWGVWWMGYGIM